MTRAENSGISLNAEDARIVKGMLARGDRQHDVAAYFGVNGGRIAEIAKGKAFASVRPASLELLPHKGPYLSGREVEVLIGSIARAKTALNDAEAFLGRLGRSPPLGGGAVVPFARS
jgi:hypothetical protein